VFLPWNNTLLQRQILILYNWATANDSTCTVAAAAAAPHCSMLATDVEQRDIIEGFTVKQQFYVGTIL